MDVGVSISITAISQILAKLKDLFKDNESLTQDQLLEMIAGLIALCTVLAIHTEMRDDFPGRKSLEELLEAMQNSDSSKEIKLASKICLKELKSSKEKYSGLF